MAKIYFNGVLYNTNSAGDFLARINPRGVGDIMLLNSNSTANINCDNPYDNVVFLGSGGVLNIDSYSYYNNFLFGEMLVRSKYFSNNVVIGNLIYNTENLNTSADFFTNIALGSVRINTSKPSGSYDHSCYAAYNIFMDSSGYSAIYSMNDDSYGVNLYSNTIIGYSNSVTGGPQSYHVIYGNYNTVNSNYLSYNNSNGYNESCLIFGRYNSIQGGSNQTVHDMLLGTQNELTRNKYAYGIVSVGFLNHSHTVDYGFTFGHDNYLGYKLQEGGWWNWVPDDVEEDSYVKDIVYLIGAYHRVDAHSGKIFSFGYNGEVATSDYIFLFGEGNIARHCYEVYSFGERNIVQQGSMSIFLGQNNNYNGIYSDGGNYYIGYDNVVVLGQNFQINNQIEQKELPYPTYSDCLIAKDFDSTKYYYKSDYEKTIVYYQGNYYSINVDTVEPGPFNPSEWKRMVNYDVDVFSSNNIFIGNSEVYDYSGHIEYNSVIQNGIFIGSVNECQSDTLAPSISIIYKDENYRYSYTTANCAAVIGCYNVINGVAYVFGRDNFILARNGETYTFGAANYIEYGNSLTFGYGVTSSTIDNSIRLGFFPQETIGDFFELGNGTDDNNRSTIIRIDAASNIYLNSTIPTPPITVSNGIKWLQVEDGDSSWVDGPPMPQNDGSYILTRSTQIASDSRVDEEYDSRTLEDAEERVTESETIVNYEWAPYNLPPIPTVDGDYKLHISNGTATWVLLS